MSASRSRDDGGVAALQVDFVREVLRFGHEFDPALLREVIPGGTLTAAAALAIHRDGYVARLTEQLGETYATVWRVLGDEGFFDASARFVAQTRSNSHDLSDYGHDFADFLARSREGLEWPFLVELARLELAFHEAFHAGPHGPVDAAWLAGREDLARLRLRFGPSVRLLALGAKVLDLFAHRLDEEPPSLDGLDGPESVVVHHGPAGVGMTRVEAGVLETLADLQAGARVGEALDALAGRRPDDAQVVATRVFETLGSLGLVASVQDDEPAAGVLFSRP